MYGVSTWLTHPGTRWAVRHSAELQAPDGASGGRCNVTCDGPNRRTPAKGRAPCGGASARDSLAHDTTMRGATLGRGIEGLVALACLAARL